MSGLVDVEVVVVAEASCLCSKTTCVRCPECELHRCQCCRCQPVYTERDARWLCVHCETKRRDPVCSCTHPLFADGSCVLCGRYRNWQPLAVRTPAKPALPPTQARDRVDAVPLREALNAALQDKDHRATVSGVAALAGVDARQVRRVRRSPQVEWETAAKIADAIDCDVYELYPDHDGEPCECTDTETCKACQRYELPVAA